MTQRARVPEAVARHELPPGGVQRNVSVLLLRRQPRDVDARDGARQVAHAALDARAVVVGHVHGVRREQEQLDGAPEAQPAPARIGAVT